MIRRRGFLFEQYAPLELALNRLQQRRGRGDVISRPGEYLRAEKHPFEGAGLHGEIAKLLRMQQVLFVDDLHIRMNGGTLTGHVAEVKRPVILAVLNVRLRNPHCDQVVRERF